MSRLIYYNGPAYQILVPIEYAQTPPSNIHSDLSHRAIILFFLSILLLPYFVDARGEGSGEPVHILGQKRNAAMYEKC